MRKIKTQASFRIGAADIALLAALVEDMGISQADVIRLAVRELAARRGIAIVPTRKQPAEG